MTRKIRLFMLPVQRKDIEHPSDEGLHYITESITDLARVWIAEGKPSRTELTISGYDDDPRELYEIPEVCQWANQIFNQFPALLFFITSASIDRFTGWLCGPVSRQAVTSQEFAEKFASTRKRCVSIAIGPKSSDFLISVGADMPTISSFYFQSMAELIEQQEKPKQWWQFWK